MYANRAAVLSAANYLVQQKCSQTATPSLYDIVTEGRRSTPAFYYGWCGDYVTYVLMQGGVTNGGILNRAELNGGKWTPGENIARVLKWGQNNGQIMYFPHVNSPHSYQAEQLQHCVDRGDVLYFARPGGDHVGIFEAWTSATTFTALEGNLGAARSAQRREHSVENDPIMQATAVILIRAMPAGTTASGYTMGVA